MSGYSVLCHALEIALIFPSAIMALIPVRRWLRVEIKMLCVVTALVVLGVVTLGAFICAYYDCPSMWFTIAVLPLLFALYSYANSLRLSKQMLCFVNATALGACANVYTCVLNAPIEVDNGSVTFLPVTSLVCLGVATLLMLAFMRTFVVKIPMLLSEAALDDGWTAASCGEALMTALLIWMNPTDMATLLIRRIRPICLLAIPMLPLSMLLLFDLVWRLANNIGENARLRQENAMLSMEEKRYGELRSYMRATRELRHDFRHHMRVIGELAKQGRTEELREYAEEYSAASDLEHVPLCANPAVDAVAAYFDMAAAAQDTRIEWSLNLPEELPVKEVDLCAILSNLVENALNAVRHLPDKSREVTVGVQMLSDAMVGIAVRNPYAGTVRLARNGLPRRGARDHGIGLASVAATVQRYHGTLDIKTDGGVFSASALLYA